MSSLPQSERNDRGRDALGFVADRCPHCGAALYLSDDPDSQPICLNACTLPAYLYRRLCAGALDEPEALDG